MIGAAALRAAEQIGDAALGVLGASRPIEAAVWRIRRPLAMRTSRRRRARSTICRSQGATADALRRSQKASVGNAVTVTIAAASAKRGGRLWRQLSPPDARDQVSATTSGRVVDDNSPNAGRSRSGTVPRNELSGARRMSRKATQKNAKSATVAGLLTSATKSNDAPLSIKNERNQKAGADGGQNDR